MKLNLYKIVLFFCFLFGGLSLAYGQNMNDSSYPEKVSFKEQLEILKVLKGEDEAAKQQALQQISENPDAFIPPVLHRYSGALFDEGKNSKGWFWHFVAELRGRIDANLSSYEKAMRFVSFITNMNAAIIKPENKFERLEQLEETVKKVIDYVRETPVSYQRNWLVLLKFKAEPAGGQEADMKINLMKPESKWDEIKQKTIDKYYSEFQDAVKPGPKKEQKTRVTAIVLNYTSYPIGRVQVNKQRIVGSYARAADERGPGSGGGHIGLKFTSGPATVKWMIGGKEGEPMAGEHRTAQGVIPEPPEEAKNWQSIYLGVHIYPDTVRFTLSDDIPTYLKSR